MSLGETLRLLFRRISDRVELAIDDANGDVVEALAGHVCDANCWHNTWVGSQKPHWLGYPGDGREHAFPEEIVKVKPGGRRRYYSACGSAALRAPLYYLAKSGRCEVCAKVLGRHGG